MLCLGDVEGVARIVVGFDAICEDFNQAEHCFAQGMPSTNIVNEAYR